MTRRSRYWAVGKPGPSAYQMNVVVVLVVSFPNTHPSHGSLGRRLLVWCKQNADAMLCISVLELMVSQGVVTYALPVEAFATRIKNLDW